jgi:hypothetical protein
MHYAFVDEFGGVSAFAPDEPVLVIAAVVTGAPRNLDLLIKRAHRSLGAGRAVAELKASHAEDKVIRRVLQAVAAQDVVIIAVAVDKRGMVKPPREPEDLYRRAVALAVRLSVTRWPRLEVILDKRYTQAHLRRKLERCIRDEIADVPEQAVVIRQEDSQAVKGLQVADFVAWAVGQKHQRGDDRYFALIEDRVAVEEIIAVK